jgi:hypothetical protein
MSPWLSHFRRLPLFLSSLCIVFAGMVVVSASQTCAQATPGLSPQQMLERANRAASLSDVETYQIHAVLRVGGDHVQKGELRIYRDADRFRWEVRLDDFTEVHVSANNKVFIYRTRAYPFPGIDQVENLELSWRVKEVFAPNTKFSAFGNREVAGAAATCFTSSEPTLNGQMQFCFDRNSGSLLHVRDGKGWQGDFSNYISVSGQLIPTRIILKQPITPHRIEISNLTFMQGPLAEDLFNAPAGAREFSTCDQLFTPSISVRQDWQVSQSPDAHLYAVVETDGTVREVQIHDVRNRHYRNILTHSLKDMRFAPALCNGHAITYEMDLPLEFAPPRYETPEDRNHQMGCDMIGQCGAARK